MSRPRHPDKHIERSVRYAESLGWRVQLSNGQAWGRLLCPISTRAGCIISVWSTPRKSENHARHFRGEVDQCPHGATEEEAEEQDDKTGKNGEGADEKGSA